MTDQRAHALSTSSSTYLSVCRSALQWARTQGYRGYCKFDGNDSPVTQALSFGQPFFRLVWSQAIARSPINIRPLLLVKKGKNPKGLALFAQAYLDLYELEGRPSDAAEARRLLDYLLDHRSPGVWHGPCWGYDFNWQSPGFWAPAHTPNVVVSCVVGQALLRAGLMLQEPLYLEAACQSVGFFRQDLPRWVDTQDQLAVSYVPVGGKIRVVNVNAQLGGFFGRLFNATGEPGLRRDAARLLRFVTSCQTGYGAWYYTFPPEGHPNTHDNYHTSDVINGYLDYMESTADESFRPVVKQGLDFYRRHLFLTNGAPKWRHNRPFPHDAHGSASGIITFCTVRRAASNLEPQALTIARGVGDWALAHLWNPQDHRFYYQKGRWYTKRFTLMRWSQAWMCRALALLAKTMAAETAGSPTS